MAIRSLLLLSLGLAGSPPAQEEPPSLQSLCRTLLEASYPSAWETGRIMAEIEAALRARPSSPLAEIMVRRWIRLARQPGSPEGSWWKLQGLLGLPDLHGLASTALREALSGHLRDQGREEEADALSTTREYVTSAFAIGPFGDQGSSYHGEVWPPELREPDLEEEYEGRFGKVRYRWLKVQARRSTLDLRPRRPDSRGCHYGLVQVKAREERPGYLEIRCSGSFEAWWNGRRIASIDRLTDHAPGRFFLPGILRSGWNRILVKTTAERSSVFSLRFVDDLGRSLKDLLVEGQGKLHPPAKPAEGEGLRIPPPFSSARAWLEAKCSGKEPFRLALLGNLYSRSGSPDLGLELVQRAHGEDPVLQAALLEAWRLARHIPSDLRRQKAREILGRVEGRTHRHLFLRKVDRLFADDRREQALKLLAEPGREGRLPALHLEFRLLERMGWKAEAWIALERLHESAPENPDFNLELARWQEKAGHPARALATVEEALSRFPFHSGLLGRALSLSRKLSDFERQERYIGKIQRRNLDASLAKERRVRLLAAQGRFAEAAELFAGLGDERAQDPDFHEELGDLLYESGRKEEAVRSYERSLELGPDNHSLREGLVRLRKGRRFPEVEPFQLEGMKAVLAYEPRPGDATSSTTLLLDQMIIRVYEDGSSMEETYQLRRLNDRRGIEAYEEAGDAAQAEELLQIRTIHPDGRWFAPLRVGGTFSMPNLKPGCFIEEHYRNYKTSPRADSMETVRFFFQSPDEPFHFSRFIVILPKGKRRGEFHLRNFPEEAYEVRDMGKLEAHLFLREDMPRLVREERMPPITEVLPWVGFGETRKLGPLVRRGRQAFQAITYPFLEIRKKAKEITKGLSGDLAKAKAIHAFIQEHAPGAMLRPGSSQPMSVLLKQEGDPFALHLALLRSAGIPWTPTLVRPVPPAMDPDPEPVFPAAGFYSLRAARVEPRDGETLWLIEGSPRHSPFGRLPPQLPNLNPTGGSPFLLLVGDQGLPGRLPTGPLEELASPRVTGKLLLGGKMTTLEARVFYPGVSGQLLKQQLKSQPKNIRELFARDRIAANQFPGFTPTLIEYPDLEKPGGALQIRFRLERSSAFEKRGGDLALPPVLPPLRLTRIFGGRSSRRFDWVYRGLSLTHWVLEIDPGGHRFKAVPKGLLIRRMILDYGLSFSLREGRLTLERKVLLEPGRIPPGRYKEFLDLCRRVDDTESRRILIR